MHNNLPKVAFVCVHNACRSQMAEAISRTVAFDDFESFSAGTSVADAIQPDAVRLIEQRYGVDMAMSQAPKTLDALPEDIDVVITMGCNVECPQIPARFRFDWGLDDPTGKTDDAFFECIEKIETNVHQLQLDLPRLLQD